MPAVTNPQFPPPWEGGPGPADPAISAAGPRGLIYTGSGYAPNRGGTGEVGTINAGATTPVTGGPQPAQVRFFVGTDGNLYALENVTGLSFKIAQGGAVQPPIYSPTAADALEPELPEPKPAFVGSYLGQKSPQGQWYWQGTGSPTDDWQPT